ncbi:MAG: hypothetical protein SYC29_13865 [Planctomycetota bacterium]|nr:hypothetical protein [Planctomycetota bacterium]
MFVEKLLAGIACIALGAGAQAAYILIDDIGGPVEMRPGTMPGMLDPGSGLLTEDAMSSAHAVLNDAGIATDGYVTFILAQTQAGLAFTSLIDSNGDIPAGPGLADSALALSTTAPISLDYYVNAEGDDLTDWSDLGNGLQKFEALYGWDDSDEGDGFAWSGLALGDSVSFHFTDVNAQGLDQDEPFRFVSYNGGEWSVVATGDFSAGRQFVFSFQVLPTPGALGLLALAGLRAGSRRRR